MKYNFCTNSVISKQLLVANLTYLSTVCPFKEFRKLDMETTKVVRTTNLSTADEQYLKVTALRNREKNQH